MLHFSGFGCGGSHSVGSVGSVGEIGHDARLTHSGIYYGSVGRLWSFPCGEHIVGKKRVGSYLGEGRYGELSLFWISVLVWVGVEI